MGNGPKSLQDFAKKRSNANQNSILGNKQKQDINIPNTPNGQFGMPQMNNGGFGQQDNGFQKQDYSQQGEFSTNFKPNFEDAYKQVGQQDVENSIEKNTSFPQMGEVNNANSNTAPIQMTPMQQSVAPQPIQQPTPQVQSVQMTQSIEEEPKVEKEFNIAANMREEYQAQPYKPVQMSSMDKRQGSSIVSHMQEIEQEIDGLVNNTEAFLNNTKALKIQILQAKSKQELGEIMNDVHNALREVPDSFIDAETRRKIRVCFSYLQKTKLEMLDAEEKLKATETSLQKLVAIDDIDALEQEVFNVTASPTVDNIYEVRTFEINLLNQLPIFKENMLRERMRNI